jgi:cytoplasmic iron level regulating protein YaaA (DUF328/UPF0246 family)
MILISPSKTLDFETACSLERTTEPRFLDESQALVGLLKTKKSFGIQELMGVSEKIADLNAKRFDSWERPFTAINSKPAILAFKGDVYEGLGVEEFDKKGMSWLQDQLRILSGLYGLLRPLDLIQPYRLEMGIKLENDRGKNLYHFWGDRITELLLSELRDGEMLVNLASNEYFKSITKKKLDRPVVTPQFKDWKNGQYKMISFYAKRARGLMVRYMTSHKISRAEDLHGFDLEGYGFNSELSKENEPVFTRKLA